MPLRVVPPFPAKGFTHAEAVDSERVKDPKENRASPARAKTLALAFPSSSPLFPHNSAE